MASIQQAIPSMRSSHCLLFDAQDPPRFYCTMAASRVAVIRRLAACPFQEQTQDETSDVARPTCSERRKRRAASLDVCLHQKIATPRAIPHTRRMACSCQTVVAMHNLVSVSKSKILPLHTLFARSSSLLLALALQCGENVQLSLSR